MIRIIGIQRNENPEQEFVLLQNQGSLRISLRGHILISECAVEGQSLTQSAHIFTDDVQIPAGMYVMLVTGCGEPKWSKTKDGALLFYAYMNRQYSVWGRSEPPLHLLTRQHSYSEPREPALLLK